MVLVLQLYAPKGSRDGKDFLYYFETMSQPVHRRLRRVQAFLGYSDNTNNAPPTPIDSETPEKVRRLFKVFLKDPWDDYSYIRHLGQTVLALRKASSFQLADIRAVSPFEVLGDPPILPYIKHPNIATINEIYCYDDKVFLVAEYLEVSFTRLGFQKYDFEEREIATIIAEVPDIPLTNKAIVDSCRF